MGVGIVVILAGAAAITLALFGGDDGGSGFRVLPGPSTSTTVLPEGWLPRYDADGKDPAVGQRIPEVSGKDLDGGAMSIGPDGRPKVIVFVAHWCPHCQREVPVLAEHLRSHPVPDGVDVVAVSTAEHPGAENYPPKEWLARERWKVPTLEDDAAGAAGSEFGLSSFPYFVAVDADGRVVERRSGELTTEQFDDLVEAARTGRT